MVNFSNKESEKLYYELIEAHKNEFRNNSIHVKRFSISEKLGVNRFLFILAEYAVGNYLRFKNGKNRETNVKTIINLESKYEDLYNIFIKMSGKTKNLIIDEALVKEPGEIKEKPVVRLSVSNLRVSDLRESILGLIGTVGLLETEKTLRELLAEVEAEKSKHLNALYGTGE